MTAERTTFRTRLGRARGLGAAKDGTALWWAQRVTAVALVPLLFWLVASLAALAGAGHAEVVAWLRGPVASVLMLALIVAGFHHLQLGLQVVIEDYVHAETARFALVMAVKFVAALAGLIGVLAVLRIALGA